MTVTNPQYANWPQDTAPAGRLPTPGYTSTSPERPIMQIVVPIAVFDAAFAAWEKGEYNGYVRDSAGHDWLPLIVFSKKGKGGKVLVRITDGDFSPPWESQYQPDGFPRVFCSHVARLDDGTEWQVKSPAQPARQALTAGGTPTPAIEAPAPIPSPSGAAATAAAVPAPIAAEVVR